MSIFFEQITSLNTGESNLSFIDISGDYAYVIGDSRLVVINIADKTAPYVAGVSLTFPYNVVWGLRYYNNHVYVANAQYVAILNVVDPSNPFLEYAIAQQADSLAVSNSRLYVSAQTTTSSSTLSIFDISDPSNPFAINYRSPLAGRSIAIDNSYIYLNTFDILEIYDRSDSPSQISVLHKPTTNSYYGRITVHGNYVYEERSGYIYVYDVTNHVSPSLVNIHPVNGHIDAAHPNGNHYYYTASDTWTTRANISDPLNIVDEPDTIVSPASGVYSDGTYVYTAGSGFWPFFLFNIYQIIDSSTTTTTTTTTTGTTTATTTTSTTTTTTTTIPERQAVLRKVETVEVSSSGNVTQQDGSDNKATLNTINSDSLELGPIAPGEISQTKIIFLRVPAGIAINNIKIGLIDDGGISLQNDTFGIEILNYLDYNVIPNSYFQGINADKSPTSAYNVSVENNGALESQYVYLNVKLPANYELGKSGTIRYKWFFDYDSGLTANSNAIGSSGG